MVPDSERALHVATVFHRESLRQCQAITILRKNIPLTPCKSTCGVCGQSFVGILASISYVFCCSTDTTPPEAA